MNQPSPSLAELQRWMRWAITDPRGVADALIEPNPKGKTPRYQAPYPDAGPSILASRPEGLVDRLSIYAEAYFARILESLEDDFASTRRQLGEERFTILIADYLKEHPSRVTNITEVGRHLPAFANQLDFADKPWIPDLIQLEWLILESFYAENHPDRTLDVQALSSATEAQWEKARIHFTPGTLLFSSHWPVDAIRTTDDSKRQWPEDLTHSLIYRKSGAVFVTEASGPESRCLALLLQGRGLSEATSEAGAESATDLATDLTNEISTWFARWTELGILIAVDFPKPTPDHEVAHTTGDETCPVC